jgi:hypothetical protein
VPENRARIASEGGVPYGFRTFRCLELALYHSLGKLPEPESTADHVHQAKLGLGQVGRFLTSQLRRAPQL